MTKNQQKEENVQPVLCTIGIGEDYFYFGLCALASAFEHSQNQCDFVMFYANVSYEHLRIAKDRMPFIIFENIEFEIECLLPQYEQEVGGFYYRKLKPLPFLHSHYLSRTMLFIDADCLCFSEEFMSLFDILHDNDVLVYGSYKQDFDSAQYQGININEAARFAGIDGIIPMGLHSGIMGRKPSANGLRLFINFYNVTRMNFINYKSPYYAGEPYMLIAYQMTFPPPDNIDNLPNKRICDTPQFVICLPEKTEGEDQDGIPIVRKHHCDEYYEKTVIYHFLSAKRNNYYLSKVSDLLQTYDIDYTIKPQNSSLSRERKVAILDYSSSKTI